MGVLSTRKKEKGWQVNPAGGGKTHSKRAALKRGNDGGGIRHRRAGCQGINKGTDIVP